MPVIFDPKMKNHEESEVCPWFGCLILVLALIQQQSSPSRRFKIKTEPKKGKPEAEK
jgi:hypothetical protein